MFLSYYGLEKNLFQKEINTKEAYESKNYKNIMNRLNYLKEVQGIGLFIGSSGMGKTYVLRCFTETLNKDLYQVIYMSASHLTVFEFLNALCIELGLDVGNCYRNDVERKIQQEIKRIKKEQNKNVILILDNAENLTSGVILELKALYDFEMDSVDYVGIILMGNEKIKEELKKSKYESLKQRIIVQYTLENIKREEVKGYIETRLKLSGQPSVIFNERSINALYQVSSGNIRKLNHLIITCMIIGYQNKSKMIDEEIVRLAKEEIEL